jgi:hypothetical protein
VVFVLFAVPTKQVKPIYNHAPWLNDPYDTLYSFTMFFVPLTTAFITVHVSLCRKIEALPVQRVRSILRGCRVTACLMTATLVSCWTSVALATNRAQWNGSATAALLAGLVLVTGLVLHSVVQLIRTPRMSWLGTSRASAQEDWLGDAVLAARRQCRWFGPVRPFILSIVAWSDRVAVTRLRSHPVCGAAVAALVFGTGVGLNQGVREGYVVASTVLTIGLLACGMFAFLMIGGSYLGLVRSEVPLAGPRRRLLDATVISCLAALIALAFRNSLLWIVGTTANAAGIGQFAALLGVAVVLAFVVGFVIESLTHAHRPGTI